MNEFEEENNDIPLQNTEESKIDDNQRPPPEDENKNQLNKNQINELQKDDDVNNNKEYQVKGAEPLENRKHSNSNNVHNSKYPSIEEKKETNDFPFNKKLRNTMTGLGNNKMKYESGLIDIILKVEKDNVNHYLRGDLAEIYEDVSKNNELFKNDVFLANVDNFEKKTGNLDKKPIIPYNCSEDISFKLDKFPKTNEIIDKFTQKIKTFQ